MSIFVLFVWFFHFPITVFMSSLVLNELHKSWFWSVYFFVLCLWHLYVKLNHNVFKPNQLVLMFRFLSLKWNSEIWQKVLKLELEAMWYSLKRELRNSMIFVSHPCWALIDETTRSHQSWALEAGHQAGEDSSGEGLAASYSAG